MVILLHESTGAWYTDSKINILDISFYLKSRFLCRDVILAGVRYARIISVNYSIVFHHCLFTRVVWKVLNLAYDRRETRDKWPLGRGPDRSWCHLRTRVKLSCRSPWLHGHWRLHSSVLSLSPWIHGLRPRKLYTSGAVSLAPVRVLPNGRLSRV